MGTAIFEKSQGTQLKISDGPLTALPPAGGSLPGSGTWIDGSCASNEISYDSGQKQDIDVTALCSDVQESTNGLSAPPTISLNRNWAAADPMLHELETAADNDELRGYQVIFPSGNGYEFLAEITQNTWSVATGGKVAATYSLRLRGKPRRITAGGSTT